MEDLYFSRIIKLISKSKFNEKNEKIKTMYFKFQHKMREFQKSKLQSKIHIGKTSIITEYISIQR
jgi:hypothetical protein